MVLKSDPELMAEVAAGHTTAFDELVKRHQVGLLNFFHRLVWDAAQAEDLAQEVFIKLYTHAKAYEPQAKFSTYLYRIARNCWIDHLRRTKSDRNVGSLDAESEEGSPLSDALPVKMENPAASAHKSEISEVVIEAIESLPEEHKLVFVLSEVQGMKYQEISETLDIPMGTVKSRMFHATKRLRDHLKRAMKGVRGPWDQ